MKSSPRVLRTVRPLMPDANENVATSTLEFPGITVIAGATNRVQLEPVFFGARVTLAAMRCTRGNLPRIAFLEEFGFHHVLPSDVTGPRLCGRDPDLFISSAGASPCIARMIS